VAAAIANCAISGFGVRVRDGKRLGPCFVDYFGALISAEAPLRELVICAPFFQHYPAFRWVF
jgi:hypothetical protein